MTYPPRLTPGTRVRDTQSDETGTVVTPGPFCGPEFTPVEFDRDEGHTFVSTWNVPTAALEILTEQELLNEIARAIDEGTREAQAGSNDPEAYLEDHRLEQQSGFQKFLDRTEDEAEAYYRWRQSNDL